MSLQKTFTQQELLKCISVLKSITEENPISTIENTQVSPTLNFGGKSILVVDDNVMNRRLASSMLNKLFKEIEIVEASNGEIALELQQKHQFEIIFMDVQMPGISGYETKKKLEILKMGTIKQSL